MLQYRGLDARGVIDGLEDPLPPTSASPVLVMMVGLPGSGKSTLSQRIGPIIGAVVLESDAIRRRFFAQPSHDRDESRALFRAINDAMTQLLRRGISVILDATNLRESDRRQAEAVAHNTGARLIVVHLTAPVDIIEERLRRRELASAACMASAAGIDVYHRMARTMQPPAPAACLHVDTSDQGFYEVAVEAIIRAAASQVPAGK